MPANIVPGLVAEFPWRGKPVRFFVRNLADPIQNMHAAGAFYEEPELNIIERYLKPGGVVLDVGANVGNHSVFFAKFCGQSEVIPVEPNPEALLLLRLNLILNQLELNTRYLGMGLADRELRAEPTPMRYNLGGAQMVPNEQGRIMLVPGDKLFEGKHIDFIKLDVEGHELAALAGLERVIAACRPRMFIEVGNENRPGFDAWLAAHDYRVLDTFRRYAGNENFLVAAGEDTAAQGASNP